MPSDHILNPINLARLISPTAVSTMNLHEALTNRSTSNSVSNFDCCRCSDEICVRRKKILFHQHKRRQSISSIKQKAFEFFFEDNLKISMDNRTGHIFNYFNLKVEIILLNLQFKLIYVNHVLALRDAIHNNYWA